MDGGHPAGGSETLGQLVDEYGEFIAADLLEVYGFDLRDLFRTDVSPRWVLALIKNLPLGSRFFAERRGGQQFRGWDESRYAMVAVVNAVRALQYTYVAAHSKSKPPPPEPFPIPDKTIRKKQAGPGSFAFIAAAKLAVAKKAKAD